ncbi:MAG: hypothetical protein IIC84_08615 [Chloroflexi bacterium]|nr:hypothetical protein [Chloroflexota bacterium]
MMWLGIVFLSSSAAQLIPDEPDDNTAAVCRQLLPRHASVSPSKRLIITAECAKFAEEYP